MTIERKPASNVNGDSFTIWEYPKPQSKAAENVHNRKGRRNENIYEIEEGTTKEDE